MYKKFTIYFGVLFIVDISTYYAKTYLTIVRAKIIFIVIKTISF